MRLRWRLSAFVFLLLIGGPPPWPLADLPRTRVGLITNQAEIRLSAGAGLLVGLEGEQAMQPVGGPGEQVVVASEGNGLKIADSEGRVLLQGRKLATFSPREELITLF